VANGTATCSNGQCGFICNSGYSKCGNACVDTDSDPAHCGECNDACGGNEVCSGGQCVGSCGTLSDCGGECVDLNTDPDHCGTCTTVCPQAENAVRTCSNKTCSFVCTTGFKDCARSRQWL
jgi:hypothetical protein